MQIPSNTSSPLPPPSFPDVSNFSVGTQRFSIATKIRYSVLLGNTENFWDPPMPHPTALSLYPYYTDIKHV